MRRVILDTNYFRSLREADLAPVRERGFAVSLGMSAFYETWAAAARAGDPGLIIGPARALSTIVDPTYPIAPNGGDLLWRFDPSRRGGESDRVRHRYNEWAALNWKLAATGNIDTDALQSVGIEADEYLRRRGKSWQDFASPWPEHERRLLKELSPRQRQARLVAHVTSDLASHGFRASMVRSRLHAFHHVAAWHMWNTALGATKATENDSEDLVSLMHLAEPAFFLTHDRGLISAVDESGTYQAPWVLKLSEFLGDDRALGRPWGEDARRAAQVFQRHECMGPCRLCGGTRPS